jgi:hypothetical protein
MIERGILFGAPMVISLRRDVNPKLQTRRVVKWRGVPPGINLSFTGLSVERFESGDGPRWKLSSRRGDGAWEDRSAAISCRYGKVGDRLWVRETWQADPPHDGTWASTQWAGSAPNALSEIPERFMHPRYCLYRASWLHGTIRWRPAIHMPRWASRITLEVTGVRVERLMAISEEDAIAEGIEPIGCNWRDYLDEGNTFTSARRSYQSLWESINGPGSWNENPFVWVISFREVPR